MCRSSQVLGGLVLDTARKRQKVVKEKLLLNWTGIADIMMLDEEGDETIFQIHPEDDYQRMIPPLTLVYLYTLTVTEMTDTTLI